MEITKSFQGKMFEHIPFTPYGYVEIAVLKQRGGNAQFVRAYLKYNEKHVQFILKMKFKG